jgi:hypothetical protein
MWRDRLTILGSQMKFKLRLIPAAAVAFMLAACGDSSTPVSPPVDLSTTGIAVDGYLDGAKVTCADTAATTATTSTLGDGKFTFPNGCHAAMTVTGGKNHDSNTDFKGILKAAPDAKVISPLTTLVQAGMSEVDLVAALGLPVGTKLSDTNPMATGSAALQQSTKNIQSVVQGLADKLASLDATGTTKSVDMYSEVMKSLTIANVATLVAAGADLNLLAAAVSSVGTVVVTVVSTSKTAPTAVVAGISSAGGALAVANSVVNDVVAAAIPTPATYLYLASDSIGFDNGLGLGATSYTMAQFQTSPGIAVKWPMVNAAAINFTLGTKGTFTLVAGQTTSAALEIADADASGKALIKAYIDIVNLSQSGTNITVSVPSTALARVYGRAPDGTEAISSFADTVGGATNTLSTTGTVNSIVLGNVINNAMNRTGSVAGLINKTYKVTFVVTNLPLRLANGTAFSSATIVVPGSIDGSVAATTTTGSSLTGYITLAP